MTDKHYQTVASDDVKKMPQNQKKKDASACVRTDRKQLFVERHFGFDKKQLIILENYRTVEL